MDATEKLLHIMILLQFTSCSCLDKITANQTFREGNLLVSKGNEFAFGFFSPGSSSNRYLGIWFYKVSEKSVVWVANRNDPISGSSGVLSINQNGNLVLYSDPDQKVPLWSTNLTVESSESNTPVLQLLNSGNLVLLQGRSERIVWQSFDYPTDTLLSGMRIGLNCKAGFPWMLTSWRSANDPRIGDYSLKLDRRGSPQFFLYKFSKPYWRSSPWPWGTVMDMYNYTYVNNQNEIYYTYHTFDASFISRGVVHYSGFAKWLRQHNGQWKEFWSVPESRCDFYAKCGAFSKCSPSYTDKFECSCLPGYEPKFPRDWLLRDASGGCIMKREDPSSLCGQGEGFIKVENVKLPDTSAAIWIDMNMSHMRCEQECKKNCNCSAYASIGISGKGSGCLAWYGQLWDTVDHAGEGFDLYVRVDAVELAENERKLTASHGKERNILVLSVSSAWIIIFFLIYLWLKRRKTRKKKKSQNGVFDPIHGSIYHKNTLLASELGGSSHPPDITFFDLNTMVTATNNFSPANKLGQGGFGSVYKGQLFNGQEVAVKRLSINSVQGIEEFKNEVMLIAKLQHRNLVKIVGCCSEGGEQMLIYEYLPNRSLDSFLFDQRGKSALDWRKRFNLIIGIARGILYLHQDSRLRIIHRDLKSSNILLDAEMNPKISDFGLARIFKADQIQEKTNRVVGTYGYMSPEYAVFGKFSVKSDVFSFGVILLEIITGKKSNDFRIVKSSLCLIGHVSERNYSETIAPTRRYTIYINCSPSVQVWELWIEENVLQIVDSSLDGSYPPDEVLRCIQIGLLCVQEDAAERPTMSEVILLLNSGTALPSPKQPAYIFRASSNNTNSFGVGKERSSSVNEVTVTTFVAR